MTHEIVVVDNASQDDSAAMVARQFPRVKLIPNLVNHGYAQGNNLGFGEAQGDWIVTLNPDTEVNAATFDRPLSILQEDPKVGCVGIKQIGLDGKTQASVRGFPTWIGILGDLLKLRATAFDSYRLSRFDYGVEQTAPQPMGTFLMFRRQSLAAIGDPAAPFDPQFPIFFNEVDLLYRLLEAGYHCVYTPRAFVLHHGGESTKQVRPQMIWESHRSLLRYFQKHSRTVGQRVAVKALAPVIYFGALIRAKGYHDGFRA